MKQDEENGHGGAPAARFWHCPVCNHNSATADWLEAEFTVRNKDTGKDETRPGGRKCPQCGHVFTLGAVPDGESVRHSALGTLANISEADGPGPVGRDDGSGNPWCAECNMFHVAPKNKIEHANMRCRRPWPDWEDEVKP